MGKDTDHITTLKSAEDFPLWSKEIKHYFHYQEIWDVVEGTKVLEDIDIAQIEERKRWKKSDGQASTTILSTIDPSVKRHILSCETASEMYTKLKSIYEQDTAQQKCVLLRSFYNYKYNPSKDAQENIAIIEHIQYRLNALKQPIDDTMVCEKILDTIPKEWDHINSAWEATEANKRTLSNLTSRLAKAAGKSGHEGPEEEKKTVCYRAEASRYKPKKKVCYKCGLPGHYQRFCPENQKNKAYPPCKICSKTNHPENACHFGPGGKFYDSKKPQSQKRTWTESQGGSSKSNEQKEYKKPKYDNKGDKRSHSSEKGRKVSTETKSNYGELCATSNNSGKNIVGGELCASIAIKCEKRNCQQSCCVNVTDSSSSHVCTQFCVDSGCTAHMTDNVEIIKHSTPTNDVIKTAKKELSMKSLCRGKMITDQLGSQNIRFVPDLDRNLLSVSTITEQGKSVCFTKDGVQIIKGNIKIPKENILVEGTKTTKGLFMVNLHVEKENLSLLTEKVSESEAIILHRKMGHMGMQNVKRLPKLCDGVNVEFTKQDMKLICEICKKAKQSKDPHNTSRERATGPLKIIHADVCGPITPITYDGKRYFLIILDDFSNFCVVFLMKEKSETFGLLKRFILEAENYLDRKVYMIRCDNGGEFKNRESLEWTAQKGIIFDFTVPHCPQLNGKAERLMRTLADRMRALLFDSKLPANMWGEAVLTSSYLINRSPTSAVNKLPAEIWFNKRQDLSHLHIFGSTVYAKILSRVSKLESRTRKGMFLGYTKNGVRLWDKDKREIFVSRDNVFTEEIEATSDQESDVIEDVIFPDRFIDLNIRKESLMHETEQTANTEERLIKENNDNDINESEIFEEMDLTPVIQENHISEDETPDVIPNLEENQETQPKYSLRNRSSLKKPSRYSDFIMEEINEEEAHIAIVMEERRDEAAYISYRECIEEKKWEKAIQSEKDSLEKNRVWKIVDREEAEGKTIVSSRWVFVIKDDGTHKARLVAKGCQQNSEDLDYKDIFSPVVDFINLRVLFALAAQNNSKIISFDVKTAFLNGSLDAEIYMEIPEGYSAPKGKVCKLRKALYGLKQAPLRWYKRLTQFLHKEGLTHVKSDKCIFTNKSGSVTLAIHVDDGLIFSTDDFHCEKLLTKLQKEFEIKIYRNPSSYLGIQIKRTSSGITLYQHVYAKQVLQRFGMEGCKIMKTPMVEGKIASSAISTAKETKLDYCSAVGSLLYLCGKTRPDLTYSVHYASRYMNKYSLENVIQLKRILRYLQGSLDLGIHFESNRKLEMSAYSDSDYAGSGREGKMRSTTGYAIFLGGGPVCWNSQRQHIVATSTTEAEYIAAAECCKKLKVISTLLTELRGEQIPAHMHVDNQSAIGLIKSGQMGKQSKHIDVRYFFISERFDEGLFSIKHCPTEDQIADIFTKPLTFVKFKKFRDSLCSVIEEQEENK